MSELYLCYDLKGIQSFIYAVPRLKYISGGSALIDRFDREFAPELDRDGHIFSGGGKGAFRCKDEVAARALQKALVQKAHDDGLSICFGCHEGFSEAAQLADQTYPYLPKGGELDGHPCEESGLYPVPGGGVHEIIRRRAEDEQMNRWYEEQLLKDMQESSRLPKFIADPQQCEFMRNVSETDGDEGDTGFKALGSRNRWAIIAMDGNDMGLQHRKAMDIWNKQPDEFLKWLKRMSNDMDQCCREACRKAIERTIILWAKDREVLDSAETGGRRICLPIRPLIVGGDDIVVLCHARYALDFVKEAAGRFNKYSETKAAEAKKNGMELWPATGGELTISAGVLFAPVTLPLAMAIPYAESLMASAKGKGRTEHKEGKPSPACVDWESVTEGVLDSPANRRQRELLFLDHNIDEFVRLTRRPYKLEELGDLKKLASKYEEYPNTILHQVLPSLKAGYWKRREFIARLGKHQADLANALEEPQRLDGKSRGRWQAGTMRYKDRDDFPLRSSDVVDAILLLEEKSRMQKKTGKGEDF